LESSGSIGSGARDFAPALDLIAMAVFHAPEFCRAPDGQRSEETQTVSKGNDKGPGGRRVPPGVIPQAGEGRFGCLIYMGLRVRVWVNLCHFSL
jgi:hypothetical protein